MNDRAEQRRPWRAGRWSAERRGADVADLRFDGRLVLRAVQVVIRDPDWRTLPAEVLAVEEEPGRLAVSLRFRDPDTGEAVADGALVLDERRGGLTARVRLESLRDQRVNRAGLIVLHPPTLAGTPLTVRHPDGEEERTRFPERIAPHQPALDVAGLAWTVGGGRVHLGFEGDVFEMEDQRNWTDASYKTYSTPLARPFPVVLPRGAVVEQAMTIEVTGAPSPEPAVPVRLVLRPTGALHPAVGVGATTAPGPREAAPAGIGEVHVELRCGAANARGVLERASAEAAGRPLDVRLVAEDAADVAVGLDAIDPAPAGTVLGRLGVVSAATHVTEPRLWSALVAGADARPALAGVPLVGGTRAHFTELNRTHDRLPADLPSLAFSITPQMHATDAAQLVESVAMQRLVAEEALRLAAGRPVIVGPVTLRARFNAVATRDPGPEPDDPAAGHGAHLVPDATDPRQTSAELEAWTIASGAALALPGIATVHRFEARGPRGLADEHGGYPVLMAVRRLHEVAGLPAWSHDAAPDQRVWALAAATPAGLEADVANLLGTRARVVLVAGDLQEEIEVAPRAVRHVLLPLPAGSA